MAKKKLQWKWRGAHEVVLSSRGWTIATVTYSSYGERWSYVVYVYEHGMNIELRNHRNKRVNSGGHNFKNVDTAVEAATAQVEQLFHRMGLENIFHVKDLNGKRLIEPKDPTKTDTARSLQL